MNWEWDGVLFNVEGLVSRRFASVGSYVIFFCLFVFVVLGVCSVGEQKNKTTQRTGDISGLSNS